MTNIQGFEISHLNHFEPKDKFENLERDMSRNIMDISKTMLTLFWEEKVLAIVGVTEFRKGAGEVWLLPSVHVDKCKLYFYKTVKSLIYDFVFPVLKFHRLELAIEAGWMKGMKWAEKLGFTKTYLCEAYDSNYTDHWIYTRILWR